MESTSFVSLGKASFMPIIMSYYGFWHSSFMLLTSLNKHYRSYYESNKFCLSALVKGSVDILTHKSYRKLLPNLEHLIVTIDLKYLWKNSPAFVSRIPETNLKQFYEIRARSSHVFL